MMSKYTELKAAAEANYPWTAEGDAAFEAARRVFIDYEFAVRDAKARFDAMNCQQEDSVLENARDAGLNEDDLDFWEFCISDAHLIADAN